MSGSQHLATMGQLSMSERTEAAVGALGAGARVAPEAKAGRLSPE